MMLLMGFFGVRRYISPGLVIKQSNLLSSNGLGTALGMRFVEVQKYDFSLVL
jgi:hypothetical protein